MSDYRSIINNPSRSKDDRLAALKAFVESSPASTVSRDSKESLEVNNHIHTIYSFSPYTPSMAALLAKEAGLGAAGSVDHDSISAAEEMHEACAILGIGSCTGFEVRVSFKEDATGKPAPWANRKINNPDSLGIAYMTVQGIPVSGIDKANDFLRPLREVRLQRTLKMTESANAILKQADISLIDFQADIVDCSQAAEGGGITERHLLAALANKLILHWGKGAKLVEGIEEKFLVKASPKIAALLTDANNPHYLFDLLGVLKANFLPRIFIQPNDDECIPAKKVCEFAASIGAIPAYAYLGDVAESPTGDKAAEHFEDDFIDPLFDELVKMGYLAVTYMPPRNTEAQLKRVQQLCAKHGLMEISGVDINSSRQLFNCPEVLQPAFRHLIDSTWALIAHEWLSSADLPLGIFSHKNPLAGKNLETRLAIYAKAGRDLDLRNPESSGKEIAKKLKSNDYCKGTYK
jgi:hypothetical protein